MFVEYIDHRSLINYSSMTTSRKASLDCSIIVFFSSLPHTGGGFGELRGVSSFEKGN
jgi:hypothetical protein